MKNLKKLLLVGLIGAAAITGIQTKEVPQDENNSQVEQLEKAFKEAATELEEKNNTQSADAKEENIQETTETSVDQTPQLPETSLPEEPVAENLPKADVEQELPEEIDQEYIDQLTEQIEQNFADKTEPESPIEQEIDQKTQLK